MSMVDNWNAVDDAWAQITEAFEKNDRKVSFGDPDIFPLLDEYLSDAKSDSQDMVFYETQYQLTKNAVATTMSLYAEGEIDFAKFASGMDECNAMFTDVTAAVLNDMEGQMEANIGKLIEEKQAAHFVSEFFTRIKCYLEEGLNEHNATALDLTIEPFLKQTESNPAFAEVYDKFYDESTNQDESALEETAEKLLSLIQKEEENLVYSEETIAKWIEDSIKNDGVLEANNGLGVEFNSTANSKEINIACRVSNAKLMDTLAERADVTSGEVLENTDVVAFGISSDKKEPYAVINGYEIPLTKPEQEVVREIFVHQMIQDCNLELNTASKNFNHNIIETYAKIGTEEIEKLASTITKEVYSPTTARKAVKDIVKDFDFPTLAALSHEFSGTAVKWEIRDIAAEKEMKAFENEFKSETSQER